MTTLMAIEILGPEEAERMRRAGRSAAATLQTVVGQIRDHFRSASSLCTTTVNRWVLEDTARRQATSAVLGYRGFPGALCISPNEVVCHGMASPSLAIHRGDIVNLDVTSCLVGYHGDTSFTLVIGPVNAAARRVVDVSRRCLEAGIAEVREGARLGDIGAAIEACARAHECNVVEEYGGHGIGKAMHQAPHVSHRGVRGRGLRLRAGMAITIEPMITLGKPKLLTDRDGWTVRTADGSPSAQFEHTILVQTNGCEILTDSTLWHEFERGV